MTRPVAAEAELGASGMRIAVARAAAASVDSRLRRLESTLVPMKSSELSLMALAVARGGVRGSEQMLTWP